MPRQSRLTRASVGASRALPVGATAVVVAGPAPASLSLHLLAEAEVEPAAGAEVAEELAGR
jgi:hypothetical protein